MNTIPIVAIPVSICNAIVNEGAIFIFTELADEFWLQSWNKKQETKSVNFRAFTI